MRALLALLLVALLLAPPLRAQDADADWQAILALDAGPSRKITSREEARTVGFEFLARQEEALRAFLARHPSDPRALDAKLRLAYLLTTRSDLAEDPKLYKAAVALLEAALEEAPEPRRADVAFAQVALAMRRMPIPDDEERHLLAAQALSFQKRFPNDARIAPLLAEVAALYDDQPKRQASYLKEALRSARTDALRAQVSDDLKRLSLLGHPVPIEGTTEEGTAISLAGLRGKVAVFYFFAGWSPPSLAALQEAQYLRRAFPPEKVAILGVNLDPTREALHAAGKDAGFPILWEPKGWQSPLVRGLAINRLPALWIFDPKGRLRSTSTRIATEPLIRQLLKER